MERKITINYWWKCDKFKTQIPRQLEEALEESALDRITEMMEQGYVSGELNDNVNMDIKGRRTPEDGWECRGWFDITKEEIS